jgi:hypothetical protein
MEFMLLQFTDNPVSSEARANNNIKHIVNLIPHKAI